MSKFFLKNNSRGFTLIEALVAISILMVAVAAPITIAQKGLSSAVYSKDQMIAAYLAQDALEYIKNQRDRASINDPESEWGTFLIAFADCLTSTDPDGCRIDTISGTILPFTVAEYLWTDSDGFYRHPDAMSQDDRITKFTRKIEIGYQSDADPALVTVTVAWGSNEVQVKTLIFNY